MSREGRDFLDKCLRKNPSDRANIKELIAHDFFIKNVDKEKDKKSKAKDLDGDDKESVKEFNKPYLREASEIAVDWIMETAPKTATSAMNTTK